MIFCLLISVINIKTMQIIKRSGLAEPYCRDKIVTAIKKCSIHSEKEISNEEINEMTNQVETLLKENESARTVERIQDEVERILMVHGFYTEAKSYILYRWQRSEKRKLLITLSETYRADRNAPGDLQPLRQ